MAIGVGSLIEISLVGNLAAGKWYNVFQYRYAELVTAPQPVQIAEAWWNHVKAAYRALYAAGAGSMFTEVKILELDTPAGEYGTFAIPTAERVGTRSTPTVATFQPGFMAAGMRLVVASRATRPGQKRVPIVYETDVTGDDLDATFVGMLNTLGGVLSAPMTLGAPAAASILIPSVVRRDGAGLPIADQPITGYLVNPRATTQNSRKYGRGF